MIESLPPNYEDLMNKTHESQRKDRLIDVIGDYITDENCSPEQAYREILEEVDSWVQYHQKFLDKAKKLKIMISGFEFDDLKGHSSSVG
jgi:hypothetical protein